MPTAEAQFRLAEIEVNRSPLDEKIIGMFRYESESRSKRGPLFLLLIEIASTAYVYEQLLDVLNTTAEQARRLTAGFDADPMARFEKVIHRLNETVSRFAEESPTPIAWNRVNLFALELSDNHLCFSGIGRLTNIFLQLQDDGSYRSFDLFGSLEQPAEVDAKKVFSSLVCGDIKPGDLLFAGTSNFERLRSELRLSDRLGTLPPVTAAVEIRQDLEHRDIPDDFAALVIANVELSQPEPPVIAEDKIAPLPKSTRSVEKMHQEEQAAEAFLSPQITPLSKRQLFQPKILLQKIKQLPSMVAHWVMEQWKSRSTVVKDPVALASLRGMSAGHGSFMNKKRKMTLLAGGGIILAAVIGTFAYHNAKQARAEQSMWNLTYDQVVDRKNRAEADLVYNNEDHARQLLSEANTLLEKLDEKTGSRKKAKEDLQKEVGGILTRLKHEQTIEKATELLALPQGTPDGSLSSIAFFKNFVFAADASGQAIVQINPNTKEIKRLGLTGDQSKILTVAASKDALAFITATATALSVDPNAGKIKELAYSPLKVETPSSAVIYNRRLYALDPKNGMIWRFGAIEGGFGSESAYLKQTNTALTDAQAIAIDSNVYVTFGDGRVVRYLSGAQETWGLNTVEPPLISAAGIWTDADTDRLVIADPLGKRVLVFRKDGNLVTQYVSPDFKAPREVTADLTNKKIYVIDSNRVLQLELP